MAICYNDCKLVEDNVYRDVEEALKSSSILPDCFLIFGSHDQSEVFSSAFGSESSGKDAMLHRGMKYDLDFVKEYIFFEWSENKFSKKIIKGLDLYCDFGPEEILGWGVYSLLQKNGAIQRAPSGHVFAHPSGNKNRVFIQSRDTASDEAELFTVGYCMAARYARKLRKAKKVLVDTMGIYAYVKNALTHCQSDAQILSFHSYEELEGLNPPDTSYFCIISASTSGSMSRKMKERDFKEGRVTTLVDVDSEGRHGDVMIPLESFGESFSGLSDKDGTLIEIIGESFSLKAKPPRPVVIGLRHRPKNLKKFHKHFGLSSILFNPFSGNANKKIVDIDEKIILENKSFLKWLDDEIKWSLPSSISHILYLDDKSKGLAEDVRKKIIDASCSCREISAFSYKDIKRYLAKSEEVAGVLVIVLVSRDGGALRDVSRDLRSLISPDIPRFFIAPVGLPSTSEAWRQLESFLSVNSTPRKYGVSNWINLPTGSYKSANAWMRISGIGEAADGIISEGAVDFGYLSQECAIESLRKAVRYIDQAKEGFLMTPRGKEMKISEGFVFFEEGSAIACQYGEVDQAIIFLTMSSALQCAREHDNHLLRLCPNGYESVVLAPECFLRFNDPILQACLLRAALPSELDYSASPALSKIMKEFLLKVFSRATDSYGDAALEFVAAIAVGSLKLTEEDMDDLLKKSMEELQEPSSLLGFLLLARQKNDKL